MTSDPESTLFDFAASNRVPTNEEEKTLTELHAALGATGAPLRLRRPPTFAPTPQWRNYVYAAATITMALAIALGGFFTTRQDSTPSPTEVPEVVLGLAGQDASPATTSDTCDLTGDIPLFVGVYESPLDRTSVIVTLDQELKVVCEAQETVLAENVQIATPTQTPYVLLLMTQTGPMLLNVKTEKSLHIQQPPIKSEQTIGMQSWNGWAMLPSTENPEGISLYLLESFAEIPVTVSENAIGTESIGGMAIGANNDVVALAITEDEGEESKTLTGIFIANFDGTSHSVETPEIDNPTQIVMSPDGNIVAVVSFEGERNEGTKRLSFLNTIDGSLINEIEIGTDPNFIDINWLNDGSALLYTNGTGLHMLTEPDEEPTTILEGDNVQGLALTRDDAVVAIGHRKSLDSGGFQSVTTIVNLETRKRQELDGRDLWSGSSMATRRSTLLLSNRSPTPSSEPTVYTVVDAVTGDTLGEIEHIQQEQGFSHSSWGYNRDINVVAFGLDSVWMLTDEHGDPTLIPVPSPAIETDTAGVPVQITVSPQGMTTLRMYEPNTAWILLSGEDEWIEVALPDPTESQGVNANIGIIVGSDQQPVSAPTATPQASPIALATCDLVGDTPIIMGAESSPTGDAALLITPSGDMKLTCGESETTLAVNVDFAFPTSAPNTVMAETADGMRIINIATGDSLDFPYSAMVVLQNQNRFSTWGSWMVVPSSSDETLASLIDLRTLKEVPITVAEDYPVQESALAGFSVNAADTHAAVAVSFSHSSSSRYLQGFFIANAEGEHRFVHTQSDVLPRTIAISPDGETIATSWYQGTMESGETNISLYSTADGELIESWQLRTGDIQTEITWLDDGSGLVFTDGNALYFIDAEHPGDGLLILHEGEQISGVVLTPDPNVVAVTSTEQQEQGLPTSQTAIVNIATGEVTLLDGRDLWAGSFGPASQRSVLVLADFFGSLDQGSLTMTVVDAATGEAIDEIEHYPSAQMNINNATSALPRGDVNIFAMGPDTVWQLLDADGQPSVKEISLPVPRDSINSNELLISMDSNGQIVLTLFDPFSVWIWIPNGDGGEWIQIDAEMPNSDLGIPIVVMFIPGTD